MNPETLVCVTELNLWRVVISSRIVRASSAGTCEDDPESGGRYSLPIAKYKGLQQRSEGLAGAVQSRLGGSRVDAQMLGRLFGVKFLDGTCLPLTQLESYSGS